MFLHIIYRILKYNIEEVKFWEMYSGENILFFAFMLNTRTLSIVCKRFRVKICNHR